MKLVRYGRAGREKPGMVDAAGKLRDLSDHVDDIDAAALSPASLKRLRRLKPDDLPAVRGTPRLGPPVAGIGKIVAIGLNYADHAAESGVQPPKEPVVFIKVTTSISGPFDDVIIPKDSQKSDWEVELALAIGSIARHVPEANALDCVAGYLICNDVSEREYQLERAGQWDKGKGCDTFAPLGPWLVTRDEVPDPQGLDMWLDVNGERMQTGNTRTMIFGVAHIVSYVSRFMTLLPGDIITTGTPPGVGMGKKPQRFLKAGDVMTLGVQGLGEQRQTCAKWQAGR
ncbi:MAG TPA: fumarylacetoacetate hydrolase family protein [Methylomirabilota bacterium]|nr:fumarylacetoacetate hydrolase family protein [Methylomirabilota bacterium]